MQKVHSENRTYQSNDRFVAANQAESHMPQEMYELACERESIIGADGSRSPGECFLWGNTMRLNYDHSPHQEGEQNIVNIIDKVGNEIDPPGYLNIIALKNGERTDQSEIHDNLRNGDILVYFHPEDRDIFQFRMHHAAMYYDTHEGPLAVSLGDRLDQRYVHHIDNPVSYGPAFNAGVRSVPFHVFRFNPNGAPNIGERNERGEHVFTCTDDTDISLCGADGTFTISDEMADLYAYQARNWALVLNGNAPFAGFHTMTWPDELQRGGTGFTLNAEPFTAPLFGGETPEVYCAGLVYTNLNLALNFPMNASAMTQNMFSTLMTSTYSFDDHYMSVEIPGEALVVDGLGSMGQPIFEPVPGSRIVDEWVEGYFRGLDAKLFEVVWGALIGDPTAIGVAQSLSIPQAALDQIAALPTAARFGGAQALAGQVARNIRSQILIGAADQIASGFSQLEYQSNKGVESASSVPVTRERVEAYAKVYANPGADRFTIGLNAAGDDLLFAEGSDGQPDMEQMKRMELQHTLTRYVPPQMYFYEANRPGGLISYVGSVIHVDMLTCIDPAGCGLTTVGDIKEFSEGGPDTSLYPTFLVPNGGRHVQRILDVNAGPELAGLGSRISHRLTAANPEDVRIVLHPAGTFPGDTNVRACNSDPDCLGDIEGIPATLPGGEHLDRLTEWDFFAPVQEGGLGCTIEDRTCPKFDWSTMSASTTERFQLGNTHGLWTISVLDVGNDSTGQSMSNCSACSEGGAHSNQWFIQIRND